MRRTTLVTGAASGIGRAIAESLSVDSWVASVDLAEDPGVESGGFYRADVRDAALLTKVVDAVVEERGGLDRVVCAAGIVRDRVSWKMSDQEWDDVIAVNLSGAFNTVRAALPWLRKSDAGRVVFISSINGVRGNFGQANYSASKAGLIGLAKTLALELARDGITVNTVLPGYVRTPMTDALPEESKKRAVERTPLARMGEPADIAAAVQFLCGDSAGFITGATLPVDGGQLIGMWG